MAVEQPAEIYVERLMNRIGKAASQKFPDLIYRGVVADRVVVPVLTVKGQQFLTADLLRWDDESESIRLAVFYVKDDRLVLVRGPLTLPPKHMTRLLAAAEQKEWFQQW